MTAVEWADLIIAVCTVTFVGSLIPQTLEGARLRVGGVSLWLSIPTASALVGVSIAQGALLGLRLACIASSTCALLWAVLIIQRVVYGPPDGPIRVAPPPWPFDTDAH